MKKLLLLALSALTVGGMQARTLSAEEALARVSGQTSRAQAKAAPKLVATGDYQGLTTYYVYSNENSAMILSASDITAPVVGYLDHAVAEGTAMPPQLVNWLNSFGKELKNAEDNYVEGRLVSKNYTGIQAKTKTALKHVAPKMADRKDISPLIKTTWDQGAPYNAQTPGTNVPTGCVATAMAQAMKYYEYPACGTGYGSATYNNKSYSMNLSNAPFAWSDMLNSYPTSTTGTDAQREAVATLMKAAGYSVKMNYADDASGAFSSSIPNALISNFNYDIGTRIETRAYFTDDQWTSLLYDELNAGRPVVYSGSGTGGGHEFVCDGFQVSTGYFHFNWGWGGAYDGYFSINNMVPEGQGTGGNGSHFNYGHDAVVGLQKPTTGTTKQVPFIGISNGNLNVSASSRKVTISISDDGFFYNASSFVANFDMAITLTTEAGKQTNFSIATKETLEPGHGYASVSYTIPTSVADGEYQISLSYRINGDTEWLPLRVPVDCYGYALINIAGNTITCTNYGDDNSGGSTDKADLDFGDFYLSPFPLIANQSFTLTTTITNNSDSPFSEKLTAVLLDADYYILNEDYIDYAVAVSLAAGETKELTLSGFIPESIPTGKYLLFIMNAETRGGYAGAQIDVTGSASYVDVSKITISSITTTPATLVAGETFSAKIKYKNSGSAVNNLPLELYLCTEGTDGYLHPVDLCCTPTLSFITTGIARTLTVNGAVSASTPAGSYFLAVVYNDNSLGETTVTVNVGAGVDDIVVDNNTEYQYFDLQGRPVSEPNMAPGVYIRRSGAKAEKVLVK